MIIHDLDSFRLELPQSDLPHPSQQGQGEQSTHDGFFYIPEFVTPSEERYLLDKIDECPKPKWKMLQNRRLQSWGGQVSSKNTLLPEALPDWLTRYPPLLERIAATGAFAGSQHRKPNHCLINEYLPGQGILPHEDGPAYHSAVATLSLESHTLLDIYRWRLEPGGNATHPTKVGAREPHPVFSILQEPRSLLLTVGSAYRDYLHGIAERTREEPGHLCRVLNAAQIQDPEIKEKLAAAIKGPDDLTAPDVLIRERRVSLTFRDVEKVSRGIASLLVKQ